MPLRPLLSLLAVLTHILSLELIKVGYYSKLERALALVQHGQVKRLVIPTTATH